MKEKVKKWLQEIFIDGLSGMALGLFSTLIIGTIIAQLGSLVGGSMGAYLIAISNVAKTITGAGIGVGVASKYKEGPLVTVSAAVAGMIGAFPGVTQMEAYGLGKPGEPLGAFVAALVAIKIGHLVAGKTKVDILVTPLVAILSGAVAGFVAGPPISAFMSWLGALVNVNVEQHPIVGGMIVSVLMDIILTLPISSAAIGVAMNLSGLAAGAATVGCCCNMVGFAVASYRENKVGGLIAQGVGTSMLQVPNIIRHPQIWIAPTLASAVTGPLAVCVFGLKMYGEAINSGMGTCGLLGPIGMILGWILPENGYPSDVTLLNVIGLVLVCFILPAVLSLVFNEILRKTGLVKDGYMKLDD